MAPQAPSSASMAGGLLLLPSFRPSAFPSFRQPILYILTLFLLTLACLAFVLQWRGGLDDPVMRWSPDHHRFPGMASASTQLSPRSSASGCADLLGRSRTPSFPYFRDWRFDYDLDLNPKGVKVIYRTKELEELQAKSRIWNETWLASFFYKPCNHELFVKQSLNMEMDSRMARDAGMDWIVHLDTDELIHPEGTREYSLKQLLSDVPGDVDIVIFPNYESSVERDDIKDPFTEVSMFKKNYDHLPKDVYFGNYREATRGNPNYFLTYGNGKSAARIQDHLRPNGAHRWHNYVKFPNEIKLDEAAVLHYTYPKFSDLTSRRDRCGCKPTEEDVKRCFILEFDRAAFIIASTATEEEMLQWYRERVVWSDEALKLKLLRKEILTRIFAPMVIIQGLKEAGVFSSIISSADAKASPSIKDRSSSAIVESRLIFSRKTINLGESQAKARLLETRVNDSYASAFPPQSLPEPDDDMSIETLESNQIIA